jgi:rRNA maturation RNase YbeY
LWVTPLWMQYTVLYCHSMATASILTFALSASVKHVPTHPYAEIKDTILGKKYTVSLAFIGDAKAKKLNEKHRKKSYVPNVLSFPLDDQNGEIFIAPSVAKKEAKKFNMTVDGYIGFLYIHALLHLKGLDHSDTMEKAEKKYCTKYNLQ